MNLAIKSNSRKKFLSNTAWILGERIVQIIIQLTVTLVSVRYLGPENYGNISYVTSFIGLFSSITGLGLQGIVIKKLIDEPENSGEIIGTSIVMRLGASILSIISIVSLVSLLNKNNEVMILIAILQSISLIFTSIEVVDFWFQSKLQSKYVSIAKIIATIIVAIWRIYLLINSKSVQYFAFSTTLQSIVIAILLAYLYFKNDGEKLKISLNRALELIKESYHFILSGLMVVIYTQLDKIMIGKMIDVSQVGVYTVASSLPAMYTFIFIAMINSARPIILEQRNKNYELYLKRIKQLYSFIIWSSIIIAISMLFLGNIIIYILYGSDYMAGVNSLNISTWSNIFALIGTARGIWIVAENKGKYVKKYLMFGAIINVILNLIFIPRFGIDGAAVATLITQFTTCVIAPMLYKETRVHSKYVVEAFLFRFN